MSFGQRNRFYYFTLQLKIASKTLKIILCLFVYSAVTTEILHPRYVPIQQMRKCSSGLKSGSANTVEM